MSNIPETSNKEDTSPLEEKKSPDTSTEETKRTDGSSNEESSSSPETNESETTDDKSGKGKIFKDETNGNKGKQSSNTESSGPKIEDPKTTGDKNGNEKASDKSEGVLMASLHDRLQKMSEKFEKVNRILDQDERVQQWIKAGNDPNVPFHLKDTEIVAKGAVTWINALKSFGVLSDLFAYSQCHSEETGMATSNEEKTACTESVPTTDKEKTGAIKSVGDLSQCLEVSLGNAEKNIPVIEEMAKQISNASESIKDKCTKLPLKDFSSSDSSSKCEISTRIASTTTPNQITTENLKDEDKREELLKLEELFVMFEEQMDEFLKTF